MNADVQEVRAGERLAVRFTGDGGEYFRIWIVNLLLIILTLGIYSPWAKVRRLQYFYRHTEVAGSSFDFHGRPVAILVGRILALLMFGLYNYYSRIRSPITVVVLLVIAIAMPWLLRNSFRFRLFNTSWRGLRFSFHGSLGGAYRVFLLNGVLTVFTAYLLAPFAHQRLKAYQHGNARLGQTPFSFHAGAGTFYLIYLLWLVAFIGIFVIAAAAGVGGVFTAMAQAAKGGGKPDPHAMLTLIGVLYGAILVLALLVGPAFQALISNAVWNNTRLGGHRFECRQTAWGLMGIQVSNFVLVLLTLGFFAPWAMIRSARYRIECMSIVPATDLQEFVAGDRDEVAALGQEAAAVFDIDISL